MSTKDIEGSALLSVKMRLAFYGTENPVFNVTDTALQLLLTLIDVGSQSSYATSPLLGSW